MHDLAVIQAMNAGHKSPAPFYHDRTGVLRYQHSKQEFYSLGDEWSPERYRITGKRDNRLVLDVYFRGLQEAIAFWKFLEKDPATAAGEQAATTPTE